MARPGITALIPTLAEDVVAIFEQSELGEDRLVLEGAQLMHASIGEDATFYDHPLENGRFIVDHRIILPVTIELRIILTDQASILGAVLRGSLDFEATARDIYQQMRTFFRSGTFLSIQTRTDTYRRQVIQSMPHEETSSLFNGVIVSASLSEVLSQTADVPFLPADTKDSNTVERGRQNTLGVPSGISGVTGSFVA